MDIPFGSLPGLLWVQGFLHQYRRQLRGKVPRARQSARRIRRKALALLLAKVDASTDPRSLPMIASCSVVLSAYRELQSSYSDEEAFEIVRSCLGDTSRWPVQMMVRAWLALSRRPLSWFGGSWLKKQCDSMGPLMEFEQQSDEKSFELIVRRCGYHQFFLDAGTPGLTRVFCMWDRNWMDLIDRSSRQLQSERPSTISTGGSCCRFRIVETESKVTLKEMDVVRASLAPCVD